MPKQNDTERDGVMNPQIIFQSILDTGIFDAKNLQKSTVELTTCALEDSLVHQQKHSPSSRNTKRNFDFIRRKQHLIKIIKQEFGNKESKY